MLDIQFVDLNKCSCYEYTWLELKLIHFINNSWLDSFNDLFSYGEMLE